MAAPKRFYCPFCGAKITLNEWRWLKYGPGKQCFDAACTGDTEAATIEELEADLNG